MYINTHLHTLYIYIRVTTADPKGYVSDALNAVPVFARKIYEAQSVDSAAASLNDELTKTLKALLRALKDYVGAHHSSGLTWAAEPKKGAKTAGGAGACPMSTDTEKMEYQVQFLKVLCEVGSNLNK